MTRDKNTELAVNVNFKCNNNGNNNSNNKWSKNFDERSHRRLVTPHGGEWIRPNLTPSNKWFLGPHESAPKRHLDRLSRFRRAHERDQQTDRPTTLLCVQLWVSSRNFRCISQCCYINPHPSSVIYARVW